MGRDQITFDDIKDFVSRHALTPKDDLKLDTRLGMDLRIVGDDAEELLSDFAKKFDVDLSDFNFSEFFPDEATASMHYYLAAVAHSKCPNNLLAVIRALEGRFWRIFAKKRTYREVTLEKLLSAARDGMWRS